ncbi:MAG: hypothetical protein P8016_11580 [Sedimentisphaerales bacterium]
MKKLGLVLACSAFLATGCTSGYRVHVNGYSEPPKPIKPNATFYVEANDPNSRNPIFDNQIKAKIEAILKWYKYVPVSDINQCEYVISFREGMSSHGSYRYEPFYNTYLGFHSGYRAGYSFGYTTYVPYYENYYDQWLSLEVSSRNSEAHSNTEKVVWVGEAVVGTSNDDMRKVIDYLLVGCFDYFGVDTTRQRSVLIKADDPRILDIKYIR